MSINLDQTKDLIDYSYMSNEEIQNKPLKGYKLDTDLSTKNHKVFVNENGKPFISYRGTSNRMDAGTDVKKFLGLKTHRQEISDKVNNTVINKYGQSPTLIGHSLGGALGQDASKKGQEVITYNKMTPIPNILKKRNKNQTDIRTHNDLISRFIVPSRNNVTIRSKSYNPIVSHSTKSLKESNRMKPMINYFR